MIVRQLYRYFVNIGPLNHSPLLRWLPFRLGAYLMTLRNHINGVFGYLYDQVLIVHYYLTAKA